MSSSSLPRHRSTRRRRRIGVGVCVGSIGIGVRTPNFQSRRAQSAMTTALNIIRVADVADALDDKLPPRTALEVVVATV